MDIIDRLSDLVSKPTFACSCSFDICARIERVEYRFFARSSIVEGNYHLFVFYSRWSSFPSSAIFKIGAATRYSNSELSRLSNCMPNYALHRFGVRAG